MLQQTRVDTVIPYWTRFLEAYPTVHALAEAPLDGVLSLWSGLGYYRRARMLHEGARQVARAHGGSFPDTAEGLLQIKGVGRYTAGAVASIAFDRREALVDGNVARVLSRLFAIEDDVRSRAVVSRLWALAEALVPEGEPGAWNQALMELGATTCIPKNPGCLVCPVRAFCDARAQGKEHHLPRSAPKAKPKAQRWLALVAVRGARVLLGRRRPEGTFGGLWEPPLLPHDDAPSPGRRFEGLVGAKVRGLAPRGHVRHILSHLRLEVEVLGGRLLGAPTAASGGGYDAFELVDIRSGAASRGLSTFARKVLAQAKVE